MTETITMPSLGADMTEGKLLQWRIKVGDKITKGQIVADIETQKAAVEMESFKEGVVTQLNASPMEILPVGATLATLESVGSPLKTATPQSENRPSLPTPPTLPTLPKMSPDSREENSRESLVDVRKAIAKAMSRSKKEIPHYYLKTTLLMDPLLRTLDELNKSRAPEDRLLLPAVIAKLIGNAVAEHPEFNGFYLNDQFEAKKDINLALVISLKDKGVITPVLHETQNKTLFPFDREFKDLIERTRAGTLRSRDLSEGTLTLTNLGDLGAEEVFGVIFPPQVALLGLGRIHLAPVADGNGVRAAFIATLSLSADHRATDGITGSRFLQTIQRKIKEARLHE